MKKYVWCEDTKSGLKFWELLFGVLYPEIIVESKGNNTGLRKAVSKIENDAEDQFYIIIDNAIDNQDVLREVTQLKKIVAEKKNVHIIKIHSFEFVLLTLGKLEDWVFAKQDNLKDARRELLKWKEVFVNVYMGIMDAPDVGIIDVLKRALAYSSGYNSEQLASRLLEDITKNTGFETTKSKLGDCFSMDCCNWTLRQEDDFCGLDDSRISLHEKMRCIYEETILKGAFSEVGL